MFCLSVVDHIRLDFGHVAQNYTVHAEAAERLAGHILKVRVTILALLAMTVVAAVAAIVLPTWNFDVSVAIASSLALAAFVAQTALGLEGRVHAHRTCAHRLWLIAEGYRALLTELQDGLIDPSVLLRRRDQLIERDVTPRPNRAHAPLPQQALDSILAGHHGTGQIRKRRVGHRKAASSRKRGKHSLAPNGAGSRQIRGRREEPRRAGPCTGRGPDAVRPCAGPHLRR